ncbi:Leader peptidase (Prepilin peptidase) / N-methyltransferase [uncultured Candidatus Thioglobus sp.]|nr:Leader peptidase (Prepilin peptidase) / N-methyltransferase [uncultured Candidatus Thioglobus sp.]
MILFFTLVFGLLFGSFLNVVISRLPLSIQGEDISINHPRRSFCPNCKHTLGAMDLIPILSFIWAKAKCRYCQKSISLRYPLVEISTALASVLIVSQFSVGIQSGLLLLFAYMLIALFVIDLERQLLPDILTLPLLWLGLIYQMYYADLQSGVIGAIAGYLFLWSIYWLFKLIRHKEGMGYGDFKLLAVLGAWFGWQALAFIVLASSILGIIWQIISKRNKNQPFAFGPMLILAALFYVLSPQPMLLL